jgi:molybdenum cofactor biosynthesis enzyme MoaA
MEYVSCEWIESRLVLEQRQVKFCCIGHSGNKGYVPICDYDGGEIPVEQIKAAREWLTAQNNSDGDSPCKGCHFLQKKDWAAERKTTALLDTVYVSNFSICNLHCRYCFVYLEEFTPVSHVAGYQLLPVFERLVKEGHLAADGKIEWGGGEPTIVKGFAEIMRMLMQTGHTQQIHTSSVKFSPELAEGLRLGKVQAVTSVDAGTRQTYKEVKGRDRFDVVWENVGKYAATGGDMSAKYILRKNNSDAENIRQFIARCHGAGIKKLVLTPDFREISQQQVTEETIYGFALMVDEAQRHGIPVQIRDEYLNPEQMRMVTKYIPLRLHGWRYRLYRARAAVKAYLARLAKRARALRDAGKTQKAIDAAQSLLEREGKILHPVQRLDEPAEPDAPILELLGRHTLTPHPRLRAKLTELVSTRRATDRQEPLVVGVTGDGWTHDGKPGYVIVDATASPLPVSKDVWLACWADPKVFPVRMTISDGIDEDFEHTFLEPTELRVPLPEVPAGESRVFQVRTDKTWCRPDLDDPRTLGVRIMTSIAK